MSELRQAAQQALEALEAVNNESLWWGKKDAAITALRAALAEPEQPVAWWNGREMWFEHELMGMTPPIEDAIPLYTAPTPRKPLSEDEIETINRDLPLLHMQARKGSVAVVFARAVERAHGIKEQETN